MHGEYYRVFKVPSESYNQTPQIKKSYNSKFEKKFVFWFFFTFMRDVVILYVAWVREKSVDFVFEVQAGEKICFGEIGVHFSVRSEKLMQIIKWFQIKNISGFNGNPIKSGL